MFFRKTEGHAACLTDLVMGDVNEKSNPNHIETPSDAGAVRAPTHTSRAEGEVQGIKTVRQLLYPGPFSNMAIDQTIRSTLGT